VLTGLLITGLFVLSVAQAQTTPAPPPGPPQAFAAAPGNQQVALTWQPPASNGGPAATSYKVYRGPSSGRESFLANTTSTAYNDTGLTNGQRYYYQVSAVSSAGEGARSNETSATPATIPGAPRNLTAARGPGAGQVTLAWQAPASDGGSVVEAYEVYRGSSSGGESLLTRTTSTAYNDTGLTNGQRYYYQVSAVNFAGEGARSNETSATPATIPGAPQTLTATRGPDAGQITLTWQAPASNGGAAVTGYKVYRAVSSGGASSLLASLGNVLSYTDTGLGNGVTRYYEVTASNAAGEGSPSTEASATTPVPPSSPRSLAANRGPGPGQISVSWQPPADGGGVAVNAYKVYRAASTGGAFSKIADLGNVLAYTDTGLPNGATRYYKVTAANAAGEGSPSTEARATSPVPPSTPTSLTASSGPGKGDITLRWQAPSGDGGLTVTNYRVYRTSTRGATPSLLATLGNVLTYTDTGLPDGATRYYKVSSVNAAGEGVQSIEASAASPIVPGSISPEINATTSSQQSPPPGPQGSPALAFSAQPDLAAGALELPDSVVAGRAVTLTARVSNDGAAEASGDFSIRVDGAVVVHQVATIPGGGQLVLEGEHVFAQPGRSTVEVRDETRGQTLASEVVTVQAATAGPPGLRPEGAALLATAGSTGGAAVWLRVLARASWRRELVALRLGPAAGLASGPRRLGGVPPALVLVIASAAATVALAGLGLGPVPLLLLPLRFGDRGQPTPPLPAELGELGLEGSLRFPARVYESDSQPVSLELAPRRPPGTPAPAPDEALEVELQAAALGVDGAKVQQQPVGAEHLVYRWNAQFPTAGDHILTLIFRHVMPGHAPVEVAVLERPFRVRSRLDHLTATQLLFLSNLGIVLSFVTTALGILPFFSKG
jgi:fibronectin type 3 domain-containing protein